MIFIQLLYELQPIVFLVTDSIVSFHVNIELHPRDVTLQFKARLLLVQPQNTRRVLFSVREIIDGNLPDVTKEESSV